MPRRLIVLTANPGLRTPRRLVDAGRTLGIEVQLRSPPPLGVRSPPPLAPESGAAVLARPGTFSLAAVLRELRRLATAGAQPLQRRGALLDACDQWRTLHLAGSRGLAIPRSMLIRRPRELSAALATVPGPPWFVKGRRGSQGTQVLLAKTRDEAHRAGHLFWGIGASCILQEDLRARGAIERHLVLAGVGSGEDVVVDGATVLASAIAQPAPGEFRSNVHRGGRVSAIEPGSTPGAALASRALLVVGLPFAAVDVVGGPEPVLLEVNASPGLESLERATRRDLATTLLAALFATASTRSLGWPG